MKTKDHEEMDEEIDLENQTDEKEIKTELEEKRFSPLKIILALFLLAIIIMWAIPYYAIKPDPEPKNIPSLREVYAETQNYTSTKTAITSPYDYPTLVKGDDPTIKSIATKIATKSCEGGKICQAKAEYYFVRDNIEYVSDPPRDEYVERPLETLNNGGADCDGMAVLLANLEEAIGVPTRFVFIPGHVYIQIYIKDAPNKYKEDGWINLDPTCKECEFGEVPIGDDKEKTYI